MTTTLTGLRLAEAIARGRELLKERLWHQEESLRQIRAASAALRAEAWEPWYRRFISEIPDWAVPYADDPRRPEWAAEKNVGWYQDDGAREMTVNGYVRFPDGTTVGVAVPVSDGRPSLIEAWFPVIWECAADEGFFWGRPQAWWKSDSPWLGNMFSFDEAVALAAEVNNCFEVAAQVAALNSYAKDKAEEQ